MSGVSLVKGQKVKMTKDNGEKLNKVVVGLGWDAKDSAASGADFDLDASVYMLNAEGRVPTSKHFIFFNELTSPCESVKHQGDNLTGEGEGDDEKINIDLNKVPADVQKLVVVVNIFEAVRKGQNFGMVENSFMRIVNEENGQEMFNFDLNFDSSLATGVVFGILLRKGDTWAFSAEQVEFEGGLESLNERYGV